MLNYNSNNIPLRRKMNLASMTVNHLYLLLISISLFSCTTNSEETVTHPKIGGKQVGLFVQHSARHGFQYFDSAGIEYSSRYFSIPITNDTTIPVNLGIYFAETARKIIDGTNSKIFLLPRNLTPDGLFFDHNLTGLERFLKAGIFQGEHLNDTIQPGEKCVIAFGVLTNVKFPDPTFPIGGKLITTPETDSTVSVQLEISDTLLIPCGRFNYLTEKP